MSAASTSSPLELSILDDAVEQRRFTVWRKSSDGAALGESSFQIAGMYCAACSGTIEAALEAVPGVQEARVSAAAERARVVWDPSQVQPSALVAAIRAAGYDATPDSAAHARELRRAERRKLLWRLFVASFCAMQVMMFATPSYVAGPGELEMDQRQLLNWASWFVSIPVLVFAAGPFLSRAWHSVRARRISMDVPVALGILATFLVSTGATFDPHGPFGEEVYFDSFTMFISFLLGGRFLEMTVRHRAAEALEAAANAMPVHAQRVLPDGRVETVSLQRLCVGDRVRVPLGQAFPADGELVEGATAADESLLTGEAEPVPKRVGDPLVGGATNVGAPVEMTVQRVGADTRHEAIVALMRDALTQRPALAGKADRWAGPFLWGVLGLAALGYLAWSWIEPSRAVWVAVSVLIVTCPCALSLAAPTALVGGARALARRGVMLRRLDALEALARLDTLLMDKTGTLTRNELQLQRKQALSGLSEQDAGPAFAIAAALAGWSQHPVSQAIVREAQTLGLSVLPVLADLQESSGAGVSGVDEQGGLWRLGTLSWACPELEDSVAASLPMPEAGMRSTWLSRAGRPMLRLDLGEVLREDAAQAVQALQASGIELAVLTGDGLARSAEVAGSLGITDLTAAASPEGKLARLRHAQAQGKVVGMVGDGVNDAPVLAQADVSFAMGQGALIARAAADAVIVSGRLSDVTWARGLAARVMSTIRTNLLWAAVYNFSCIPLALAGWLPPWAAGLGMALSSVFVVANSARLSRHA
ncbi:heavy metal translocating P-type ATPase [Ideonella livida]|uniref:Cation-translocating P-type ATPase n=1 Tax=Ideonella livida TaxID=2707176 RepID=A0A7C9PHL9_9BURK|nr:cation-translocating P-type ATPase [Ideonella livida]NDY92156.1 cation-translocating P-type ATPase [Ideonella livida]